MKTYIYNLQKYFFTILILLLIIATPLKGQAVQAAVDVSYDKLLHGESDEDIAITKINNGFNISIKNTLEEEGHTTAYFSPSISEELETFGGFSFYIANKSEGSIKLNFIINEAHENSILENGVNVLALSDGEDEFQLLTVDNGVFELEKDFKGRIYIPFSSLAKEKYTEISSWGFTLTCRNGEEKNFDITDFAYIEKSKIEKIIGASKCIIEGDREIPVLPVGEAIVDYKISTSSAYNKFYLRDDYKGVKIDETGHLSVDSTAELSDIKVFVELEDGTSFYFKVSLYESLTKGLKGVTDKTLATPSLNEVVNNDDSLAEFFLNNKVIIIFRIIFIVVFMFVSIVYLNWRGYFKKNTKDKENVEE